MTREEFSLIVKGLKAIYADPKYIADQFAFDTWYSLLKDIPYQVASMAVQSYLQTEKFPPTPADIRKYATQITETKEDSMSELEAWSLVRKAISNGNYGAEREFEKLPPVIQDAIGSPAWIREMASVDLDELETVGQSHFVRNYRISADRHKSNRQLNEGLRTAISEIKQSPLLGVEG